MLTFATHRSTHFVVSRNPVRARPTPGRSIPIIVARSLPGPAGQHADHLHRDLGPPRSAARLLALLDHRLQRPSHRPRPSSPSGPTARRARSGAPRRQARLAAEAVSRANTRSAPGSTSCGPPTSMSPSISRPTTFSRSTPCSLGGATSAIRAPATSTSTSGVSSTGISTRRSDRPVRGRLQDRDRPGALRLRARRALRGHDVRLPQPASPRREPSALHDHEPPMIGIPRSSPTVA